MSVGTNGAVRRGDVFLVALLVAGASALILPDLNNSYLWQDEASTACIARTILTHGIPMGHDEKNSFSHEEGRDVTPGGVYKFQPWVQFYLCAASFALWGESAVTARLPFALFGIATVALTYFLGRALWRSRVTAGLGACILMLSVPFLLLAGQCRYYSPAAFSTVLALWGYLRLLDGRKGAAFAFLAGSILLLHTNHGFCIALLPAVTIHAALWHREKLRTVGLLVGLLVLVNLPWLLWMRSVTYHQWTLGSTFRAMYLLWVQLVFFAPHCVFLLALIVLAVAYRRRRRAGTPLEPWPRDNIRLMLIFAGTLLVMVGAGAPRPYFRYLVPLLPLGSLVAGRIVADSWRVSRVWTGFVVFIWLLTGLLPLYVYELTHEYQGPVRGIVAYLNEHAQPEDVVATNYEDLPLKFYTKLRVVGGYTGEDLTPIKTADWVVLRKSGNKKMLEHLNQNVPWEQYDGIVLKGYPNLTFENRENPQEHRFRTATDVEPVTIYRRKSP